MSIRFAVLGLLHEMPRHGYAVRAAFEDTFGDFWELNYGQIYQVLTALEREGLITGSKERVGNRPERTVYAISSKGFDALRKWLNGAPVRRRPYRDDFYVRLRFLEKAGDLSALRNAIDRQIEASQEHLAILIDRRAAQSKTSDDVSCLFTKAAILHAQADFEALNFCRSALATRSQPLPRSDRTAVRSPGTLRARASR
jgi:DNA-binding PadR family transcriptional regulator